MGSVGLSTDFFFVFPNSFSQTGVPYASVKPHSAGLLAEADALPAS